MLHMPEQRSTAQSSTQWDPKQLGFMSSLTDACQEPDGRDANRGRGILF